MKNPNEFNLKKINLENLYVILWNNILIGLLLHFSYKDLKLEKKNNKIFANDVT